MIKLYNSLVREKEPFVPLDEGNIRLYACGPTVYNYAHIGNARMAVVFDLLARILKTRYPTVTYASNITDVDDKIMAVSLETGVPIADITEKYTRIYNEDMAAIGNLRPDVQPHATGHIKQMISLIEKMVKNGHAYESEGESGFHVLFHVPSFDAYGGLSGRSRDEQIAGARVEVADFKKDPADFVLWKPSAADQPGWDSPWGRGRPGWHIECSAMAEEHLGLPFDIHGGGADLKFPHHENEIAQSCCAHGSNDLRSFANVWVHNGFVTVEGEKMSKSLGNVQLVHDLLKDTRGEVLRLTLLSAHYRQPLDWSQSKIDQAQKQCDRVYRRLLDMTDIEVSEGEVSVPDAVLGALYDDLNTPQMLAELNLLLKEENSSKLKGALLAIGRLVGLFKEEPESWFQTTNNVDDQVDAEVVNSLLEARKAARDARDFNRADALRDEIEAMGIVIEDTPDGAKWRYN